MDIKELRNNYGFVSWQRNCELCGYPTLSRDFYLFPCGHTFHAQCLRTEMMKYLDNVEKVRVTELTQKIQNLSQNRKKTIGSGANSEEKPESVGVVVSKYDSLRDELDDIIACDCLFCGEVMIKSITEPFISLNEADLSSWAL
eukprot:TRINITY_DN6133_c0_g1_i1.p1 TRINITY_DN6133_c0_g1~~TRINITY_DN6133_c0_g1_i1.p1  ORF type:complete len:143 (+),score=43.49 TRINITY_DN6133_c0_g1_i1:76-504(+)